MKRPIDKTLIKEISESAFHLSRSSGTVTSEKTEALLYRASNFLKSQEYYIAVLESKNKDLLSEINVLKRMYQTEDNGSYTESSIARAIATTPNSRFHYQKNLIVPNVYYGWNLDYEADLISVNSSRYVSEIEIKTSKSDLKKDFTKRICHNDPFDRIRYLWYAGPVELLDSFKELCPETSGIITVEWIKKTGKWKLVEHRNAKANTKAKKISPIFYSKLARLGTLKYWGKA